MKTKAYLRGLKTLAKSGSLVFCGNCEKVLGSINSKSFKDIKLSIICTCGNYGSLIISHGKSYEDEFRYIGQMPLIKKDILYCKKCKEPLFGVIDQRTVQYAFSVQCRCGEKYDLKPSFPSRLGETLKMYENSK